MSAALAVSGDLVVGYSPVSGDGGCHAVSWDLGTTPPDPAGSRHRRRYGQPGDGGKRQSRRGMGDPGPPNVGTDPTDWSVTTTTTTSLTSSVEPPGATFTD
jgi:hypothetical protein